MQTPLEPRPTPKSVNRLSDYPSDRPSTVSVPSSLKPGEFRDTINVNGIEVSWDTEAGTCNFRGIPVAMMWVDSTLAGLMAGVQSMVGPERFHLALQSEGRKSVESDWLLISSFPNFAEGFAQLNLNAKVAGWGDWRLVEHDPVRRQCVFRAYNNWEGGYQRALGVSWGSGMLAGKLAGICSKLFKTNCWATQTRFVAKGDHFDEFVIAPSDRNLEDEIEKLLGTDRSTRADMAVALRKLQNTEAAVRESQQRYQKLVSSIPVGVCTWIFRPDGGMGFDYVSPRFCELTGLAADANLSDIYHAAEMSDPEDANRLVAEMLRVRETLEPFRWESRFLVNGGIRWLRISADPTALPNGGSVWHGIIQDVTERVELERDLHEALSQAQQLARVKSQFLANMSHEIRTPMNGIIGLARLALNEPTTPEVREYIAKIASSSETLLGILNDILDFSKLEAGRMTVEEQPFSLQRVREDLESLFAERAHSKGLAFKIEIADGTPLFLIGDSLRIYQVLSNLLGNAIKFTESGGVAIKIAGTRLENGRAAVRFDVEDTGIGISDEVLKKIFQPFSQADGTITRKFGGSGLGLAISQNLLKLMGGNFRVESQLNRGSVFGFELELGVSPLSENADTSSRLDSQAGRLSAHLKDQARTLGDVRILIAEDDAVNQLVIGNLFRLAGVGYEIANNGQEALELLRNEDFDLVLMDVHMPVMDGLTATQLIRDDLRLRKIPVLALTAGVTREERAKAIAAGLNDFIVKPFDHLTILEIISKWVRT